MVSLSWQQAPVPILWLNDAGNPNPSWSQAPASPPIDSAVWPVELQTNGAFTRQGEADTNTGANPQGDFDNLKGFVSQEPPNWLVQNTLIRAYQYVIAQFDVDAFRIDTLKFNTPDFERTFGNAMREFALSAGKKNFFTFGEIAAPGDAKAVVAGDVSIQEIDGSVSSGPAAALLVTLSSMEVQILGRTST
jgi:glycosidase